MKQEGENMKCLFISKDTHNVSGSGVGARMHLSTIKKLCGENNVYFVDVSADVEPQRTENYIAYGKYSSKLERIKRMLEGNIYLFSNHIIKKICDLIEKNKFDFIYIDDSYYGKLVAAIKKRFPHLPVIAFYHDVKANLFKIWMKKCSWIDKQDFKLGLKQEKQTAMLVDTNVVLNKAEDEILFENYGKRADYYLPVCVPKLESNLETNPYETKKKHILFVGTYYTPNIKGIRWFYDNVFQKFSDQFDLWIVGKGLEKLRVEYSDENVHIVGFVDSLVPYYKCADLVIAPLTDGGGMKIKTAEAFSFGKTFLGSEESLHGYIEELPNSIVNNTVFQCDTAEEYTNVLEKLSQKELLHEDKELVSIYQEKYSVEAALSIMKKIIENTVGEKL